MISTLSPGVHSSLTSHPPQEPPPPPARNGPGPSRLTQLVFSIPPARVAASLLQRALPSRPHGLRSTTANQTFLFPAVFMHLFPGQTKESRIIAVLFPFHTQLGDNHQARHAFTEGTQEGGWDVTIKRTVMGAGLETKANSSRLSPASALS